MRRGTRAIFPRARRAAALLAAGAAFLAAPGPRGAGPALAETRLFITNHVHSDQISGLAEWRGSIVAGSLGGLLFVDRTSGSITKMLAAPGGLPSNRVLCVAVSPSGSLWAGTADRGIARLKPDGGLRRTLTSFDGLPADRVQTIYVRGDSVWVGTSGGVALYTESASGQVTLRRSDSFASTGGALASDNVLAFQQVGDTLWCGTGAGPSTFAGGVWTSRVASLAQSVRSLALHEDTLWAATAAGPRRYASGSFAIVAAGHAGGSQALHADGSRLLSGSSTQGAFRYTGGGWAAFGAPPGGFRPVAFVTLADGSLWTGTDQGLARYEPGSDAWVRFRSSGPAVNGVQHIVADARGAWFATGNIIPPGGALGNVLHYDGESWSLLNSASTGGSLQASSVFGLLSDRSGRLWFGHCCSGEDPKPRTERWDPAANVWDTLGVTNLFVLAEAPSGLVLGGSVEHGNGVYVFDGATAALLDSLTPSNTQGAIGAGLASNNLRGIAFDPSGQGWFAHASDGLDIWDGNGTLTDHLDDRWEHLGTAGFPSSQTTSVVTTGAGDGWVGTVAGVVRIRGELVDPTVTASVNGRLPSTVVSDLAIDSGGNLWVATLAGLARVDAATRAVDRWSVEEGLAGNDVRALAWDARRSVLWVGTTEGISQVLPAGGAGSAFGEGSYVYPSPADGSTAALRLGGISDVVRGEIRDVTGALIRRFECDPLRNEVWDLRLPDGSRAASGVYVIVLRDADRARMLRVAVVR